MAGQDLMPMCSEPTGLSQAWSRELVGLAPASCTGARCNTPVMKRQRQKWGRNACPFQVLESSGNSLSRSQQAELWFWLPTSKLGVLVFFSVKKISGPCPACFTGPCAYQMGGLI